MIRRLLTFLLVACLAAPAMASPLHCVEQAQPVAMSHDHAHHRQAPAHKTPDQTAATHDCIGCIAPLSGIGPVFEPGLFPTALPVSREALLIAKGISGPDTPPPRA